MLLALEPDFLMFWNGSADYAYDFLTTNGISTYTMTSDVNGAKIESVYDDFTNMGKIFGKGDQAAEIIAAMKETSAVKEDRYIVVGLADLTVGERVADTVGLLASQFHPEG